MTQQLIIQFLGRSVTVIDGASGKPVDDGQGVALRYDTVQDGVERGLLRVMSAVGLAHHDTIHDDVARPLREQIDAGAVRVTLRGHRREIAVAALHLELRFGLALRPQAAASTTPGIDLEHIEGASDFYETFDIDSGLNKLKAFADVVRQWEVIEKPARRKKVMTKSASLLNELDLGTPTRPLTIVVTGATGKGKSTFVNALLRRSVLPQSGEGVCTAVNIKLRHAERTDAEGMRVYWRDLNARERQLGAALKALESRRARIKETVQQAVSTGARVKETVQQAVRRIATDGGDPANENEVEQSRAERLAEVKRQLAALAEAQEIAKIQGLLPVADLPRFAQVTGNLDAFVDHVEVFLHHPLLRVVHLVDAPGLRDADGDRAKAALRAFVGDAAWLYLHKLSDREATWTEDVNEIHGWAGNTSGVLIFTHADAAQPDPGRTVAEMAARAISSKAHAAFTGTREWCAALPVLSLVRGLSTRPAREAVRTAVGRMLACEQEDQWADAFEAVLRQQARADVVLDYVFDASRLPVCMQRGVEALYRHAVDNKIRNARRELQTDIADAIEEARKEIAGHTQALASLENVEQMKGRLANLEDRRTKLKAKAAETRKTSEEIAQQVNDDHRERLVAFDEASASQDTHLEKQVTARVKKKTEWKAWATFDVPVFKYFAVPLAGEARAILKRARASAARLVDIDADELTGTTDNEALADDAYAGDVFAAEERFFEWHDDALKRILDHARVLARFEKSALRQGFKQELVRIKKAVLQHRKSVEDGADHAVQQCEGSIDGTKRDIAQNDPGRSKLVYEHALESARNTLASLLEFQRVHVR